MKAGRIVLPAAAGLAALACTAAPVRAASDPATQLAEKYAPVVKIVKQTDPCGHGEPYLPADVNVVFGRDEVALRGPWDGSNLVKVAPAASDLASGRLDYNLDFPGNPLSPGCTYELWSRLITRDTEPTTYARVVTDKAHPGKLALQYWFFYVFNNFNNKHEGDWEMIQLDFDASSPEEALGRRPAEVGYSQHDGAERAHWGDDKLELVDGTHPVVYPAAGSHANYYHSALYLGRSAAQGVGCDDTNGPSRTLRPRVRVVPTDKAQYLQAYPWLGYQGRWGERQPAFYNGPTGPNLKLQWIAPIRWAEDTWRDSSFTVPEGGSVGTTATDFFCGAVAAGSDVLTSFVRDPWPVLIALAVIALLLVWLASRTSWGEKAPFRLRRRRPWGSIITAGWQMYRRHARLFLGIGLLFVPLGLIITLVQFLIFRVGGLSDLVDSAGETNAFVAIPALALGVLLTLLGLTIVQAVASLAMVELDEDLRVSPRAAYRLVRTRLRPLVGSLLMAAIVVALLSITVVGLPIAIWLLIRWSFLAQVVALEDHEARGALRRSGRLVGRRWFRAASMTLVVAGTGLLLGPVIGTLLLLLTSASFDFVNLLSALIYVVTLPFVAVVTTYLYFDLLVRERLAPEQVPRGEILPAEL
jgi:Vacuolar protein sorting-associated protein 62